MSVAQDSEVHATSPEPGYIAAIQPAARKVWAASSRPSGLEAALLLVGLSSFAAALFILWRLVESAVLAPWQGIDYEVIPWDVWIKLGVAAIVVPGLIWVTFRLFSWASRLAAERRLVAAIEELETSPTEKLELLGGLTARWSGIGTIEPGGGAIGEDPAREIAAGRWVLNRFREDSVIISVPENLADPDKIRSALGSTEVPNRVLRPRPSSARHE